MDNRIAQYGHPRIRVTNVNTSAAECHRFTRLARLAWAWKPAWPFYVLLAAAMTAFGADKAVRSAADKPRLIKVESAYLRLIDHVDVPAQAGGVLARIPVREGAFVKEDDLLVQLDDVDARLVLDRAQFDLDIARTLAASQAKVDEARTAVEEAEAAGEKANFELEIARKKAESDIPLRYSRKAQALAESELQRALAARKEFRDSVSQNEVEHLQLASDKAKLDVEQVEQDLQTAGLTRKLKQSEVTALALAVQRRQHDLKLAGEGAQIAAITQRVREHDVAVAQRELDRRGVKSPLAGVVVQIFRHKGEWVEPGAKVVRVLRIDRLRVEGFIAARDVPRNLHGAGTTVTVTLPDKSLVEVRGKIVFVSPEFDALNQQVLVWAEVENPGPQFVLRPGMKASMAVDSPDQ
jgi:multidrug efflux pump subunit AcrA (membrane-fusion protein)